MKHYLWLDLETTGSTLPEHHILEVGCVLTGPDLVEICEFHAYVEPQVERWDLLFNDTVAEMHVTNGLLRDHSGKGQAPGIVDDHLVSWMRQKGCRRRDVMIAGSGVGHFDRRFIAQYMPRTDKFLHYAPMDVGVVRRFAANLCGWDWPPRTDGLVEHRALDDARSALAQAVWLRDLMVDRRNWNDETAGG